MWKRAKSGLYVPAAPAIIGRRKFVTGAAALAMASMLPKPAFANVSASLATQSLTSTGTSGTTPSFNSTGANAVFVFLSGDTKLLNGATVTDNLGNGNATSIAGPAGVSSGQPAFQLFGWFNPNVGASHTVNILLNGTGNNGFSCAIDVRSGLLSITNDLNVFNTSPSPSSSITDSGTPAHNGELCYLISALSTGQTPAGNPGSGFGNWDIASLNPGGTTQSLYVASQVQNSATAISSTVSPSNNSSWSMYLTSFQPSSYTPPGGGATSLPLTGVGP